MMPIRTHRRVMALLVLALVPASLSAQSAWPKGPTPLASADCASLNTTTGTPVPTSTGGTNGWSGAFAPGDFVTLSVTMNTATSSSVSIVGNSTGTPVLAGPLVGAGTLNYTVTGPLPPGAIGIGWYVNSTTPGQTLVNVGMTCGDAVPAWPPIVGVLAAAIMLMIGFLALRRRSPQVA